MKDEKPRLTIVGKILENGTGRAIFGATVRHHGSRAAPTTELDGSFKFSIPYPRKRSKTRIVVLMSGYWFRRVRLNHAAAVNNQLIVNESLTSLTPFNE